MPGCTVFFYGLFMDEALLRAQGLAPANRRLAELIGYDIRIGRRAYVVQQPEAFLWGVLFDLPPHDVDRLYEPPSVCDYRPEAVQVVTQEGCAVAALCYNLQAEEPPREDDVYLNKLIELCTRLDFPAEYLHRLRQI